MVSKKSDASMIMNSMLKDPGLRGVRHTKVFVQALKFIHDGAMEMNIIAQLDFFETIRRSAMIERLQTFSRTIDPTYLIGSATPNIEKKHSKTLDFDEMEIEENGNQVIEQ